MQLQQVDRVGFQVFQAAFDKRGEVGAVVTVRRVRVEPAAGLGGDVKFFLPLLAQFGQQPFAVAVAIDVRRVEEIHAAVERGVERGERFLVVHIAPRAADGPRAKADFRNLPARPAQIRDISCAQVKRKKGFMQLRWRASGRRKGVGVFF